MIGNIYRKVGYLIDLNLFFKKQQLTIIIVSWVLFILL